MQPLRAKYLITVTSYCLLNIVSSTAIVFCNKAVFATYGFNFVTTLTLLHTIFTCFGMNILAWCGMYSTKPLTAASVAPLAVGYVGYVVLANLSLRYNTVGFYQILKILIAPTVVCVEFVVYSKSITPRMAMAVSVVCAGVAYATITDTVAIRNVMGLVTGIGSVLFTAMYTIWAGTKQKDLEASSAQLLQAYTPQAVGFLLVLAPLLDDMGFTDPRPDTVLGFKYTTMAVVMIIISSCLGILVTLSTFLVIGATSPLTSNILGHLKTVVIITGGCIIFNDSMPLKKFLGICLTVVGIAWYTFLTGQPSAPPPATKPITDESEKTPLLATSSATADASLASQEGGGPGKGEVQRV